MMKFFKVYYEGVFSVLAFKHGQKYSSDIWVIAESEEDARAVFMESPSYSQCKIKRIEEGVNIREFKKGDEILPKKKTVFKKVELKKVPLLKKKSGG